MNEHDAHLLSVSLHIHTKYSPCAETRPEDIGPFCRQFGVDVVGITDHDTIAGALAVQSLNPDLKVIVGEEIATRQGEIIGLFLKEEILPGLGAIETCERIKEQDGLVYIPHPFDPFKVHRLRRKALLEVLDMVDVIEVFNGKANMPIFNSIAARFAQRHGICGAVGSDAHYLSAMDLCVNRMRDFHTPQEFLANLIDAELITEHSYPFRTWYVGIKRIVRAEGHLVRGKSGRG